MSGGRNGEKLREALNYAQYGGMYYIHASIIIYIAYLYRLYDFINFTNFID